MGTNLTRRDFLHLAGSLALYPLVKGVERWVNPPGESMPAPHIVIILFDALSARHLSLYGYPRKTSPNLERFAQQATVYHQHHAAANFTTPSTASLLTGAYPFSHRVFAINGLVSAGIRPANLLNTLAPVYSEAALVQNMYADLILYQLREGIDRHAGPTTFALSGETLYDRWLPNDAVFAARAYDQFLFNPLERPGSLFGALPLDIFRQIKKRRIQQRWEEEYPDGLPFLDFARAHFTLPQVIEGAQGLLAGLPSPGFSYLHFMPPHAPYRPSIRYRGVFADGWEPKKKKTHPLSEKKPQARLNELRREYDEFIAEVDAEFGRLLDWLSASGRLENSYVVFTSDHGDLFERGETGHVTPLLYEELTHIPLLIHAPGQTTRQDIHAVTSNVDLFPTLAELAHAPVPATVEGEALPGLGLASVNQERPVWCLEAKRNSSHAPLTRASLGLIRWPYKLIGYWGYGGDEIYEFYNLEDDPEELDNLADSHALAREYRAEMDEKRKEIDTLYLK